MRHLAARVGTSPLFKPRPLHAQFSREHRTAHVASALTQITPGTPFEVHPHCANDANKARDNQERVPLSCEPPNKSVASSPQDSARRVFGFRRAGFTLKVCFLYHERKHVVRKGGKRIVWSQKPISKAAPKPAGKI